MFRKKPFVQKLNKVPELFHGRNSSLALKSLDSGPVLFLISPSQKENANVKQILAGLGQLEVLIENVETPSMKECMQLADRHREKNVHYVVAIGGGKVMDAAKMVRALLLMPAADIETTYAVNFDDVIRPDNAPYAKLICIPTTPGTGSHISATAVINNPAGRKIPHVSNLFIPDLAILDATFLVSIKKEQMMEFVTDILTHSAESSVSKMGNYFVKQTAKLSCEMLLSSMQKWENDATDIKALEEIMWAGHLAGMAQSNAYVGSCHALAHALEGYLKITHGKALMMIFEPCMEWHNNILKLPEYDFYLGVHEKLSLGEYSERARMVISLSGIDDERWADEALADPSVKTNPLTMSKEKMLELIKWIKMKQ